MIVAIIAACEIGFWVLIVSGLVARYVFHRDALSMVLLALTPIVDVILLIATFIDLRDGATASAAHSLAAIYLGFSIVYGHRAIKWADARFAYHFADGPKPTKLYGTAYLIACAKDVVRTAAAAGIAAGITWLLIRMVDDPARTEALSNTYGLLAIIVAIELVWTVSYAIWPRKEPVRQA